MDQDQALLENLLTEGLKDGSKYANKGDYVLQFMSAEKGCFFDGMSMMLMTLPFVWPVILALGFDPIWFCVVSIMLIEVGQITPPVGSVLYAVTAAAGKNIETVARASLPFWLIILFAIAIAVFLWSPVIITTLIPASSHVLIASLTSSLGGSIIACNPTKIRLCSAFPELYPL